MEKNNKNKKLNNERARVFKTMRLIKKLTRIESGIIFDVSPKTIEKLENGRGLISEERLLGFSQKYGFNLNEFMKIRTAGSHNLKKWDSSNENIKNKEPKRRNRRFCRPKITRECKVLRQMREERGLSQCALSKICGFSKNRIGFYECGRKNLDKDLIQYILSFLNFSMDDFNSRMQMDEFPYEVINDCNLMMRSLDVKTLKGVRSFLKGFMEN